MQGDPAVSAPRIRINTCIKAAEMFKVQCKIVMCPKHQARESKYKTETPFGRMNNPVLS